MKKRYFLLQLPLSNSNLFKDYKNIKDNLNTRDYVPVYTGEIETDNKLDFEICEELFRMFNIDIPEHFAGHSMSVSDIVVLSEGEGQPKHYYYCDGCGFQELKKKED